MRTVVFGVTPILRSSGTPTASVDLKRLINANIFRHELSGLMNTALSALISDYLSTVSSAVRLMQESGLPSPATNDAWAFNDIPQSGILRGGIKYYKHGYGCAVQLRGGAVDFDFGANGETTGFDLWRLTSFASDNLHRYGFTDENALKLAFEEAVRLEQLRYSGYILYYRREQNGADQT